MQIGETPDIIDISPEQGHMYCITDLRQQGFLEKRRDLRAHRHSANVHRLSSDRLRRKGNKVRITGSFSGPFQLNYSLTAKLPACILMNLALRCKSNSTSN